MWYARKHPYWIGNAIALPSEKTLQKVTVTVMVNDCTTVSISDMSAVLKYCMVKNKMFYNTILFHEWMNVPILTCIQLLTSASIIYHYDYSTDCHLSLRVVQNFYTSQSLGSIDPTATKWRSWFAAVILFLVILYPFIWAIKLRHACLNRVSTVTSDNKKLSYREKHSASLVFSWCTLWHFFGENLLMANQQILHNWAPQLPKYRRNNAK